MASELLIEQSDFLKTYLGRLDGLVPGLGERTLRYVLSGEGEEVLAELLGQPTCAEVLRIRAVVPRNSGNPNQISYPLPGKPHETFLSEKLVQTPPAIVYRFSRVCEVAWDTRKGGWLWTAHSMGSRWIEALLLELFSLWEVGDFEGETPMLSAEWLESVMTAGGTEPSTLVQLMLTNIGRVHLDAGSVGSMLIGGVDSYFERHAPALAQALKSMRNEQQESALRNLAQWQVRLRSDSLDAVCAIALEGGKRVSQAAVNLLQHQEEVAKETAANDFIRRLTEGSAVERLKAVSLIRLFAEDRCMPLFEARIAAETNAKVTEALTQQLKLLRAVRGDAKRDGYVDGLEALIPPVNSFPCHEDCFPELEAAFVAAIEEAGREAVRKHAEWWDRTDPHWHRGKRDIPMPISEEKARLMFRYLVKGGVPPDVCTSDARARSVLESVAYTLSLTQSMGVVPILRLCHVAGLLYPPQGYAFFGSIYDTAICWLQEVISKSSVRISLLDLATALKQDGLDPTPLQSLFLLNDEWSVFNPLEMTADEIWPFFYQYPAGLKLVFGLIPYPADCPDYLRNVYRKPAFKILGLFPRPPADFVPFLWETALTGPKADRPKARACLENFPGKYALILEALADSRQGVRTEAAIWLGELGDSAAIAPLRAALKKEKSELCIAAIMESLERLGEDIDQFLNRKQLAADAAKLLAKGVPDLLDWFPFDALPTVHWEKNGQAVPVDVMRGFLLQSVKLKSTEPGPLLRRYAALMRPMERQAFAQVVLEAWLHHDTLPLHSYEEAYAHAERELAQILVYVKQHPEYYQSFDAETEKKRLLNGYLKQCKGSATPCKGLLAVAAAMGGPGLVAPSEKYIRTWFGNRMAQCKSLLQMLAWVDHPQAIQVILSIAARFRTKGIQKEAARLADQLAERRGWTREEMMDRTVPTAGFDATGTQVLDYGERQFTARLQEDFSILLTNSDGKAIKALPDAAKSEDPEEVKAVKKDFSAARKELKSVLKLQTQRLYEAMCTEREWPVSEWRHFLLAHPLVGRCCQRLVWIYRPPDGGEITFRPLQDLSLTDVEDEAVVLGNEGTVQLAHPVLLENDCLAAWRTHLADYEVPPLFDQLSHDPISLSTEKLEANALEDFRGHMLSTFQLRGRCGKRGYTRGEVLDAGSFTTYHKTFPGLGIQAVVEFTGSTLPEEDRSAALVSLYFTKFRPGEGGGSIYAQRALKLSAVPRVLLSECWHDLRFMAEAGSGFDPDWEKRTQF